MVLAKKIKEFISLKPKINQKKGSAIQELDDFEKLGPKIYIRDVSLPITEKDIGETLTARVQIVPREVATRSTNKKTTQTYDLELTGILIED